MIKVYHLREPKILPVESSKSLKAFIIELKIKEFVTSSSTMSQGTAKKSTSSVLTRDSVRKALELAKKEAMDSQNAIQSRLRSGQIATKKQSHSSAAIYDSLGRFRLTQEDICDCFSYQCVGCHFSCEKCESPKCGPICRVNRRYIFEELDGKGKVDKNPKMGFV